MKKIKQFCKRSFYMSRYGGRLTRLEALGAAAWFYHCLRREQRCEPPSQSSNTSPTSVAAQGSKTQELHSFGRIGLVRLDYPTSKERSTRADVGFKQEPGEEV